MPGSSKNPSFIRLFRNSASIFPLAVILVASTSSVGIAKASVFSLFKTASGKTVVENQTPIQKMRILEASFSPTLNGQGGIDNITDESALIANDNPLSDDPESFSSNSSVSEDTGNVTIQTYKVKSGDTISSIAGKFGVSINTVIWANNLDRKGALVVGDVLAILPVSGIQYTVRKGDTISDIATKYGSEISDIRDYNDISDKTLIAGKKIIIPGAELSQPQTVTAQAKTTTIPVKITPEKINIPEKLDIQETDTPTAPSPIFGTLVRPKTSVGDSSDFIRPIEIGIGRLSQGMHDKWAIDIAAPIGTPILASSSGTVILVKPTGYNGGYGKYVAIEHEGGIQTLYAHMTSTKVEIGEVVTQGQIIGLVGSTGRSTGPHVHYEVRGAPNNCLKSCE